MCKRCKVRHVPPTGRKCKRMEKKDSQSELLQDAAVSSDDAVAEGASSDGQSIQMKILSQLENGNLHKHICAFCLSLGKQLGHPEKGLCE